MLVAKLQRTQFGRSSERIDPGQLSLLFEELCRQSAAQAEPIPGMTPDAESENQTDAALTEQIEGARKDELAARKKKRKKKRDRVKLRNVTTVHHQDPIPDAERCCSGCGKPKGSLGEVVTRSLEYQPGWCTACAPRRWPALVEEYGEYRRSHRGVAGRTVLRDREVVADSSGRFGLEAVASPLCELGISF